MFEPLAMTDTLYVPGEDRLPRIAPTEFDAWRGRLVQGEVHDENAFALGGIAPHAGLFSTAGDLARFCQMLLNGGVLEHQRIVSEGTVELFTRRVGSDDSMRALGWDTKSLAEFLVRNVLFARAPLGTPVSRAPRSGSTRIVSSLSSCSPIACIRRARTSSSATRDRRSRTPWSWL